MIREPVTDRIRRTAELIADKTEAEHHDVCVVLGSGQGDYPRRFSDSVAVPYEELPGFPAPRVAGHAGTLYSVEIGSNRTLLLSGRAHSYEGHDMDTVVFAVRAAVASGCRTVVLTNAAGACGEGLEPGDLVVIRDHLNLTGRNPLVGPNDESLGTRFPDLTTLYPEDLRRLIERAGADSGVTVKEGVYAWFLGPSFETPAEIRMARVLGADLVGMSTVPEAIAAHHMGARVAAVSLVTNLAAGISPTPLTHTEVGQVAREAGERFARLFDAFLPRL